MRNRNPEINVRSTNEILITLGSIAHLCSVTVTTIKKWIRDGKLPIPEHTIGRNQYYSEVQGKLILNYVQSKGYKMK